MNNVAVHMIMIIQYFPFMVTDITIYRMVLKSIDAVMYVATVAM